MATLMYSCPVCDYAALTAPPLEGEICPSCGTEFGFDDDLGVTYHDLRTAWIAKGRPWFSRSTPQPTTPPAYVDFAVVDVGTVLTTWRTTSAATLKFAELRDIYIFDTSAIPQLSVGPLGVPTHALEVLKFQQSSTVVFGAEPAEPHDERDDSQFVAVQPRGRRYSFPLEFAGR